MPREYKHKSQYEKEISALKASGLTYREIGEKLGFTRKQTEKDSHFGVSPLFFVNSFMLF